MARRASGAPRHPVTKGADQPPASGRERQRDFRRRHATKSLDVSGETHARLKALCERDGTSMDEAIRSAVEAALAQSRVDRDVVEAAWVYLEATQASMTQFYQKGFLTERQALSVQAAVMAYDAVRESGELSPKASGRVQWLGEQGAARIAYVDNNSVPAEPLAADARHGTVSKVAQTLLSGGKNSGRSLHSASLLLLPAADHEPGGVIVRVRAPAKTSG